MTTTPWGETGALRKRRLRPGPGAPRADVERSQRERLYAATVAVTTELGYGKTRVADLIETAGVSRATFYRFFDNKEECYLATLDALIEAAIAATSTPIQDSGGWEERARAGIAAFTDLIVRQPASARFCLVESFAVGAPALERVDRAMAGFEGLIVYVMEQDPQEHASLPPELVAAFVGGLRKMVHTRLHRRTERELVELLPAVMEMGLASYRPPPEPLRVSDSFPDPPEPEPEPERHDDPVRRIERATLAVVAERGYSGTSITDIATAAGVSLSTFYAHYEGKEAAFDGAVQAERARVVAFSGPAFRAEKDWPAAMRATVEASFAFFEKEPEFAKVMAHDVFGAGAEALEQLDLSIETARAFYAGGYALNPDASPIAAEAIPTFIYALTRETIRKRGVAGLRDAAPVGTYLALAPFLGPAEACAIANRTD